MLVIVPLHCADIVTVAQAAHWFDMPAFCKETLRVLKPGPCHTFNQRTTRLVLIAWLTRSSVPVCVLQVARWRSGRTR